MTPEQQLAEIKAKSTAVCQINIRTVPNGFIINGATQWQDNVTKSINAQQQDESIALNAEQVTQMALNYFKHQSFDEPVEVLESTAELPFTPATATI